MKIIFDGDSDCLVHFACVAGKSAVLMKKKSELSRNGKKMYSDSALERVFINFYSDYTELASFLGNFHMAKDDIEYLFVDLNIVKRKEIFNILALLCSFKQFSNIKIFCILNSYLGNQDMVNVFSRFFDHIFIIHNNLVSLISCDCGKLEVVVLGEFLRIIEKVIDL